MPITGSRAQKADRCECGGHDEEGDRGLVEGMMRAVSARGGWSTQSPTESESDDARCVSDQCESDLWLL